jgi:hypothetical protein
VSKITVLIVALFLGAASEPVYAWPVSLTVSTGEGDEATYKRGLFGNKRTTVKDRLGDKYETKRGIFGISKDEEYALLGNGAKFHKGVLGNSETDVHTMFGDTVKYKKNVFGWRSGKVDLHGVSQALDHAFKPSYPTQQEPIASPNYSPNNDPGLERVSPQSQSDSSLMPRGEPQEGFPLK